jgi:CubicO group peptidase (beta-lactamase class C family)
VAVALGVLAALVTAWLGAAALVYSPEYVRRVVAWQQSDLGDYLHGFPSRPLLAADDPVPYESAIDEERVRAAFAPALGSAGLEEELAASGTQALLVIKDDDLLYERYFDGFARDSMLTSFSVAKSLDSALIGIALAEGHITSVDDPITDYLPELAVRDPGFGLITIRHLLLMSSGLEYRANRWALFNGDDPLTSYYTDQREIALRNTRIVEPPGQSFSYNKYHPQLLGLVLERTTGMSVTEFTQTRLWDRLGMEFDGAWALDSEASGFEKMEAGLNARAIDFAKLGSVFLNDGRWRGEQVVPTDWVRRSTGPDALAQRPTHYRDEFGRQISAGGAGYYGFMWYGLARSGADRADFYAAGDHGQYIYVSPANGVVIVRAGSDYGDRGFAGWVEAFHGAAGRL